MALEDFQAVVQPMLAEADIATTVFVTERPHHAHEKVRDEDLSQWDTLVVMAGDGLLYEVRGTVGFTLKDPPRGTADPAVGRAGTGIALAQHNDHVAKKKLLTNCTFILCKGLHTQMDLVSLSTASGKRLFSFLGFGWGFISDVDIDSEKYRRLGNARFTLGTLQCLAKLRVYQGRLSYLPAVPEQDTPPCLPAQPCTGADRTQGAQPRSDALGHPGEGLVPQSEPREGVRKEIQGGGCWSRGVWFSAGSRGPTGNLHIPFPGQPGASWSSATGPSPGDRLGADY
uniref:Sphingosine kinase 1 n=1 Tax=Bubo bubo TaxID=30461 RepID=A0A8C0EKK6_BUBBB